MSYDFRDFIFDLSKEALKQEQESTIHQRCNAMRNKAAMLSDEERKQAFFAIAKYEQRAYTSYRILCYEHSGGKRSIEDVRLLSKLQIAYFLLV